MNDGQILRFSTCHIIIPLDSSIGKNVSCLTSSICMLNILVTTFLDTSEASEYTFISADGNSTDRFQIERKTGCTFEPGFEEIGKSWQKGVCGAERDTRSWEF